MTLNQTTFIIDTLNKTGLFDANLFTDENWTKFRRISDKQKSFIHALIIKKENEKLKEVINNILKTNY